MRAPEFWARNDFRSGLAAGLLAPASWAYGASVAWKASNSQAYRPNAKVICVGNLTVGGSGKTPIAIAVARALLVRGRHPIFLSRGYGGRLRGPVVVARDSIAADVGDEALLLAAAAPVVVARDRAAGARLAIERGADTIVMDDGHQNFTLAKDISLVVVDGDSGFGNGRVLPAGPLREPVAQGLARADAVIVIGEGNPPLQKFPGPVLRAVLTHVNVPDLARKRVVAFAGIGQPEKFFRSLRAFGADIVDAKRFGDHHPYTSAEIARLKAKARSAGAMLVTTEKDFVRLTQVEREDIHVLPVRAAFQDVAAFERLLDSPKPTR